MGFAVTLSLPQFTHLLGHSLTLRTFQFQALGDPVHTRGWERL